LASTGPPGIWLRAGNAYIGQVLFWRDDDPLPASKADLLHCHRCEFPNVVDLLRNEAPVFLFSMDLVDGVMSALMTGVEAVGDGDLQALIT
jgi:hypothetical protein